MWQVCFLWFKQFYWWNTNRQEQNNFGSVKQVNFYDTENDEIYNVVGRLTCLFSLCAGVHVVYTWRSLHQSGSTQLLQVRSSTQPRQGAVWVHLSPWERHQKCECSFVPSLTVYPQFLLGCILFVSGPFDSSTVAFGTKYEKSWFIWFCISCW